LPSQGEWGAAAPGAALAQNGLAMRRTDLMIAIVSLTAGALAVLATVAAGGDPLGYALAGVLLLNALVRYRLAQSGE